jgi:hypothetical protein
MLCSIKRGYYYGHYISSWFYPNTSFRKLDLFPRSRQARSKGPNWVEAFPLPLFLYLKTETGPVSETLCLDKTMTMNNIHDNIHVCADSMFLRNVGIYLQVHTALQLTDKHRYEAPLYCNFPHSLVTSCLLGEIFSSAFCSQIPSIYVLSQVSHPHKTTGNISHRQSVYFNV